MVISARSGGTEPGLQAVWQPSLAALETAKIYYFQPFTGICPPFAAASPDKNIERTNDCRIRVGHFECLVLPAIRPGF
jgi:hypothetical protein